MPTLIQAAINGARSRDEHSGVPVTAERIARDAREVVSAGAGAVHFHVRDDFGKESFHPEDVKRCLLSCRKHVPTVPLGIRTGARIVLEVHERLALIRAWRTLPDFASVNFHEMGAEAIASILHSRGVGIELGLADREAAERVIASGWERRCVRILLEPDEPDVMAALANVEAIEQVLNKAHTAMTRLLNGSQATTWPLLEQSARQGYLCRIGLEDTIWLPTGRLAASNAELVYLARALIARGK